MRDRVILSLFDRSGNWSHEYVKAPGYWVRRICLPEQDVRTFDWTVYAPIHGILAAPPCTEFAGSGARWWKDKDPTLLADALEFVDVTLRIIEAARPTWCAIENPVGRLRRLRPQLGAPTMTFDPCDFAGYADDPAAEAYTKRTQVFGTFNVPSPRRLEPTRAGYIHKMPGGPKQADRRSVTPSGFARAFFSVNR